VINESTGIGILCKSRKVFLGALYFLRPKFTSRLTGNRVVTYFNNYDPYHIVCCTVDRAPSTKQTNDLVISLINCSLTPDLSHLLATVLFRTLQFVQDVSASSRSACPS